MVAGAKRIYLRPEHENTITDIIHIAKNELVVTCSLNRRVYVWQVRSSVRPSKNKKNAQIITI